MRWKGVWLRLRRKGLAYWLRVAAVIVIGLVAGHELGDQRVWIEWRYWLHQWISARGARAFQPDYTAIVLIGDDEFWRGPLGARSPVRRDYLARLVDALDTAEARVIAIDFDLRAPDPERPGWDDPAYEEETKQFVDAVRRVSARRDIVLAKALYRDSTGYVRQPDVYDSAGFCAGGASAGATGHAQRALHGVYCGYIALPFDLRLVPGGLRLAGGEIMDSFAVAAVRAAGVPVPAIPPGTMIGYSSHMPESHFRERDLVLTASQVLDDPRRWPQLAGKTVIVSGAWSRFAHGRGAPVDTYPSPTGRMSGAFLHANFIEAIRDHRIYPAVPDWIMTSVEVVLLAVSAVVFALDVGAAWKTLSVVATCVGLLAVNYFAIQNLGRFIDVFVPLVFLVGHAMFDQVSEWRRDARAYARLGEER